MVTPEPTQADLLGKKATILLPHNGGLEFVIERRICTPRELRDLGLEAVGEGWAPRAVVLLGQPAPEDDDRRQTA